LLERVLQRPRLVVLCQQVGEGLIGKLLQILAFVPGQEFECLPDLRVEADQLAGFRGLAV
jgi:hypothetical protein